MSAKELKDKLKALRSDFSKPITKMTAEEMAKEIAHHESAKKTAETKAKRLEALAKAREAKKAPPTLVVKEKSPRRWSRRHLSRRTMSTPRHPQPITIAMTVHQARR
jgi:hypothetical protein